MRRVRSGGQGWVSLLTKLLPVPDPGSPLPLLVCPRRGDMSSLLNRPKSSKRLLKQGGGESQDAAATSTTALGRGRGRGRGSRSSSSSARARDTEKAGRLPSLAQVNREIMDQVSRNL